MHIPMTDLTIQHATLKSEIDTAISQIVKSGRFILGPEVDSFEKEIAAYCNVKFAIGVASGTDALILSLLASGIKPGDEVITTPFTFFATSEAIVHCGAIPVFVDIDSRTYNINTDKIESRITSKTRAIIPVHLFGQPAEMDTVKKIAEKFNLKIIEDCAQALSARYKGKMVGSIGLAGCLSFFPSKNLGAYGDGGMVLTNDSDVGEKVRILRQHGAKTTYYHDVQGYNSRLDAIQAAILRVKLKHLNNWSNLRRQIASEYTQLLSNIDGIVTPYISHDVTVSANYYTILVNSNKTTRSKMRQYLSAKGVDTAVYYPLSLHLQRANEYLHYKPGDMPESELAQERVLSLPMYPELTHDQIIYVTSSIKEWLYKYNE